MRKCDACGKVYSESKDVFCPHCGAIGQKHCTHHSSYDSSKWDRGEIYSSSNSNNTYKYGTEPHAQRTGTTYNTSGKKPDLSGDQYGSDYTGVNPVLRNIVKTATSKAKTYKKDEKKAGKAVAIFFAVIALFNIVVTGLSEIDSSESYYEDATIEFFDSESLYPVDVYADDVTVEPFEDWDGTWFFDMHINSFYMNSEETGLSDEVCDKLMNDYNVYIDGNFCTMTDDVMSLENYTYAIEEESIYVMSESLSASEHTLQYWFTDGELVYIDFLSINFDDGTFAVVTLPFDAFRCDEDGNVTYYTCNIDYADEIISFEETDPFAAIDEYECMVEF